MKTVYLLSGIAGSGKTTAAKYISEKFNIKIYSMATPLKESMVEISKLFGQNITLDDLSDPERKKKYRHQLQILGTDILRNKFDLDIFNRALEKRIDKTKSFIIDDNRFSNEYYYWKNFASVNNYKFCTIRIIREEASSLTGSEKSHPSEQLTDLPYDNLIINNSSKEDLYKKVDEIIIKGTLIKFKDFETEADELASEYVSKNNFIMLTSQLHHIEYKGFKYIIKDYLIKKDDKKYILSLTDKSTTIGIKLTDFSE